MNIAVSYQDGSVCDHLGKCTSFLIVTVEEGVPTGKRLVSCTGDGHAAVLKLMSAEKVDVLICGSLGFAARNALEMIGVLLVPGCEGSAEEAVAKFIVGESQGDPSILELAREEDPDDPMACMHDCGKCAGCGPIEVLKQIPEEKA
ncbi:NifB/NifX family molybdenum-iron cluster-binding protein [Butyricicoccus sp. Marseille-Q5471]|uniref:NifB/NifX family molybdenum-iron cluster-binding protein n=1 Tax=Butyricicoccus sp. Marseille-Q5471 TaxID=3039493 RepID=UPI0024BC252E|nr:NifB/NifX family molybdenum-iron cluster-binding protein [Butyricicoccus sp. Marseille-Q5471]